MAKENKIIGKINIWKSSHPDLYEFILFNVMSNVATVVNFIILWLVSGVLPLFLNNASFHWFIFNYSVSEGGVIYFISFLVAYICAQIVNFIVQRKLVFGSTNTIGAALPWYIATVVVAGIISVWLPPHVIALVKPMVKGFAPTIANGVNIIVQVIINYPMMKFVIMRKG